MDQKILKLKDIAKDIRLNTFKAIANAGGGHFGGSLSIIEILTVLYFAVMKIDPKNPDDDLRDRFILSKGHGGPALYVTLAQRGYFPLTGLDSLDKPLSNFPKHVDRLKIKGIEASTGALGQGLSIACGMAISLKQQKKTNSVYIVLGDGELDSGQVWEAAMTASKYCLDNILAIVDRNCLQIDGSTEDVMPLDPLDKKFSGFGWNVYFANGHDIESLLGAISEAKKSKGKPSVIIAKTVKGCGISFMEGKWEWHSGKINPEQYEDCLAQLGGEI
ncbi:MAG: transketolase [Actinobacteria bacterium]|nr:transketolase [Actinomycetota bacterium]